MSKKELFDSSNQNLHWKLGQLTPSFGSILAYSETNTYGLKYFFLGTYFLWRDNYPIKKNSRLFIGYLIYINNTM